MRLALPNFRRINEPQSLDAVVFTAFFQRDKFGFLMRIDGNDQFPAVAKGNVVLRAKFVREPVAIPSLGNFSTRNTSCHRFDTASAMAQPMTPPPIIKMLAWSMNSE